MGLEKHMETEFTCDNCGKNLFEQEKLIRCEFNNWNYYFCNQECRKEFLDDGFYPVEVPTKCYVNGEYDPSLDDDDDIY